MAEVTSPRFPEVSVALSGEDGNSMMIIGRVRRAMKRAGVPAEDIAAYTNEATSGSYDDVIQTTMRYVDWS